MNQYHLNEGDIIKIGRITVKIKSIKFKNSENILSTAQNLREIKIEKNIKEVNENQNNKVCKICYLEEESSDNPLVQPCTCSGSMKFIHLNCLKKWLNTSVIIKIKNDEKCNIYQCKKAECELCKTKFPDFIKHKGKLYDIFDFYNDFNNYLIIESLTLDKNKNKYMYIINLDNNSNKINIGRGHESTVILNDITVSRVHCVLNINSNMKKIYLSDNNSKFGTLILIQTKNIYLSVDLKLHLQIGRSYLSFLLKGNSNYFGCCGISEKKNSDYYYFQNSNKNELIFPTVKTENDIILENKYNEEINIKQNKDETVEKIKEYNNLNTNPNILEDNLEELLLLTPTISINNKNDKKEEKNDNNEKYLDNKKKEEEIIIINDSDDEGNNKNNNVEKKIDK